MAIGTNEAIFDTFEIMLENMSFEKITVLELSKKCGISPNTFYYHFEDIYDLLGQWLESKRSIWFVEEDYKKSLTNFFNYCKDNKAKIYHVYNSLSKNYLERIAFTYEKDSLLSYIKTGQELKNFSEKEIEELTDFILYGLSGTFIKFMWNDMKEDTDSIVNSASNFVEGYIKYYISK